MTDPSQKPPSGPPGLPFTPEQALEFMQKMWNPFGIPIPGYSVPGAPGATPVGTMPFPNPAAMFAALDPLEVERKIVEMKVVESWLTMTLNVMQMSIKTMELQRASLEALHGALGPKKT